MVGLESALRVVQQAMVDTGLLAWADVARVHVARRPPRSAGSPATATPLAVGQPGITSPSTTRRRRAPSTSSDLHGTSVELAVPRPRAARRGALRRCTAACRPSLDGALRRRSRRCAHDRAIGAARRRDRRRGRSLLALAACWAGVRAHAGATPALGRPAAAARRRSARDAHSTSCSTSPPPAPSEPLERIAVRGLGFRARADAHRHRRAASRSTSPGEPRVVPRRRPPASASARRPSRSTASSSRTAWCVVRWRARRRHRRRLLPPRRRMPRPAPLADAHRAASSPTSTRQEPTHDLADPADPAVLVLEDGTRHAGRAYGARGTHPRRGRLRDRHDRLPGDPHRPVATPARSCCMTAPHIGNTGMNDEDPESRRIWVVGLHRARPLPRRLELPRRRSRSTTTSSRDGVVGISGIDTRAVTRHIRDAGACAAGSSPARMPPSAPTSSSRLVRDGAADGRAGTSPPRSRSPRPTVTPGDGRADRQPRGARPRRQAVARSTTSPPAASRCTCCRRTSRSSSCRAIEPGRGVLLERPRRPRRHPTTTSSCCAACSTTACRSSASASATSCSAARSGLGTYKLPFGHRGINQPVLDKATGRVEITAHNHGFAVDAPLEGVFDSPNGYGRVEVSHVGLNDDVVEGLRALDIPAFSVQYHPEAAAGPHDANYLFDRFRDLRRSRQQPPEGQQANAQARRHQERPRHRLRPDRHRPGLRVRLLGHPGLPRAARGGRARHPRQLQPGDDHDRPRLRRRDLHRADHLARSSRRSSPRRGPTRSCRPWAARPRSTPRSTCTTTASSRSTTSS